MQYSHDRILTTHTGSLPRPRSLSELLVRREQHKPFDQTALAREIEQGVAQAVRDQLDAGLDIINDGEAPRVGFSTYVIERMTGFGGEQRRKPALDMQRFPGYADHMARQIGVAEDLARVWNTAEAQRAVHYEDSLAGVSAELAAFDHGLKQQHARPTETFMTAASPGVVTTTMLRAADNPDYPTDRDYVLAVAREMKKEYDAIIAAGHLLQLDAPDLAMERVIMFGDQPLGSFLERVELHVEAINLALADIPPEKVRLHVCWGNWQGPHQDDVPVAELLPLLYQAQVGALSIPLGNPRHEHESVSFRTHPLPEHMLLIPGVIDVTTNYLEHPEVVANRLCAAADAVGDRERIIAGTDCGFGTFASYEFVAPDVAWAKLGALSEGAALASQRLWG
ncbi:5-methyltetrahydropteroyltriglutamate--homocysteine methyltransferase [Kushneria sinocarnis]|uniref:5-methyltetrahydropteroyltriglutamate--homocysteine methyltransferase n=1 Tax=Kushneria sinocarnis TaxID=595502 RepID=A0A420WWJ2_9GAMM|nr:cobalamin-independent methionine synthase II family protein [Kushneria sinocarnis]RKR03485.1 5-methyltetrahydropteroyltriglutamate--homocysteine methyltransferase [Kushneria sinocarnis]